MSAIISSDVSAESLTAFANKLADAAAGVTVPYFRTAVQVDIKQDASPVTIADKQAEAVMRKLIRETFPNHGIFGEEAGIELGTGPGEKYLWVLDPIDGTKSFITGKPLFGTLISLLYEGSPILGIIDQPVLRERWLGLAGQQTTLNGKPINTRKCPDLKLAYMYATTPHMFSGVNEVAFNRVRDAVRIPMYGCDCYAYGLLATGLCDLVVEADLKPYDYMALVPVVQGAGGVITDWKGNALQLKVSASNFKEDVGRLPGEVLAAGDPDLHRKALEVLAWR